MWGTGELLKFKNKIFGSENCFLGLVLHQFHFAKYNLKPEILMLYI